MPTFRFHRGSLKDSMKTAFVVFDKDDLWVKLISFNTITWQPRKPEDRVCLTTGIRSPRDLIIKPYCFDDRIGWNTHLVLIARQCVTMDPYIIGFLSDDFTDKPEQAE